MANFSPFCGSYIFKNLQCHNSHFKSIRISQSTPKDMYTSATKLLFLLSILVVCSCGSFLLPVKKNEQRVLKQALQRKSLSLSRKASSVVTIRHDFVNPPATTFPTNPVTTPVTNPVTTPAIVTVPSANPVPVTTPPANPAPVTTPPANPAPVTTTPANPVMNPPVPVTNPVTTPSVPGGQQPVTNPVTNNPNPGGGVPTTNPLTPPLSTNAPAAPGQSWCVAKGGAPEMALQAALDYACGIGGVDCSAIQVGASCYNPNSLEGHASYAFNSYYQRNPLPTSCDFGGTAVITNVNPSSGSCIFTTRSPSSASPMTPSPITTTPTPTPNTDSSSGATTPTGSGTQPGVFNPANPALGGGIAGNGESPLAPSSSSSISMSSSLRAPFIGYIVLVTFIITGRILLWA